MASPFLNAAQLQIFNHVMAWGNLRLSEICSDPFVSPASHNRSLSQPILLPSDWAIRYLERVRVKEKALMSPLGIDPVAMEKEVSRRDGPSFNNYISDLNPPWLSGPTRSMSRLIVDDLWQVRQARINVSDRIGRWKRTFGAKETADSRPNVVGFTNHLTWLQDAYAHRSTRVNELKEESLGSWELVESFYDPAQRAAQNILYGALALKHYLKIPTR